MLVFSWADPAQYEREHLGCFRYGYEGDYQYSPEGSEAYVASDPDQLHYYPRVELLQEDMTIRSKDSWNGGLRA